MNCFTSCVSQLEITVNRLHIENVNPLKFNILDLFLCANKLERERERERERVIKSYLKIYNSNYYYSGFLLCIYMIKKTLSSVFHSEGRRSVASCRYV